METSNDRVRHLGVQPDAYIDGPFSLECVLPSQFARRRAPHTGEERLIMAVLEDAIRCFFGDDPQARIESTVWLRERGGAGPFAFENICDVLGLEAGQLRKGLFRQRASLNANGGAEPSLVRFSRAA